jgi:hypothetical protein
MVSPDYCSAKPAQENIHKKRNGEDGLAWFPVERRLTNVRETLQSGDGDDSIPPGGPAGGWLAAFLSAGSKKTCGLYEASGTDSIFAALHWVAQRMPRE